MLSNGQPESQPLSTMFESYERVVLKVRVEGKRRAKLRENCWCCLRNNGSTTDRCLPLQRCSPLIHILLRLKPQTIRCSILVSARHSQSHFHPTYLGHLLHHQ